VGENPTIPTILNAAVAELSRHLSSKQTYVGEIPASSANLLPDGVKVARRSVNPLVLVRVQVWQPTQFAICIMQFAILGGQADISWLRLSRKQDLRTAEVGALPTPSAKFNLNQKEVPCVPYSHTAVSCSFERATSLFQLACARLRA
jgi:hypothetical protein